MKPPSRIIMVSVDDLRYDCVEGTGSRAWLEKYGAADACETPTMNNLVKSGVSYERATSTSSYTPPSHASLFTGAYPSEHGVKTFFNRLSGQTTIADALGEAGYETVAWVENMALRMLDVTAGFDRVVCPLEEDDVNLFEFVEESLRGEKVFIFLHLFDVHKPYGYATGGIERTSYNEDYPECLDSVLPPRISASALLDDARDEAADVVPNYGELTDSLREYADFRSLDYLLRERLEAELGEDRFELLVRLYVEGVNRFDQRRLGDLLEHVGDIEDSLLVFTSDHGETRCQWGEREDLMNSFNVSEGAVRVPLVFKGDMLVELVETSVPVSHVDVFPTLGDLVGVHHESPSGHSLYRTPDSDRAIYNESWYYSGGADFFGNLKETGEGGLSEVAIRIGDCKLIRSFAESGTPDRIVRRLDEPIPEDTDAACFPLDTLEEGLSEFLDGVSRSCSPDIGPEQGAMEDRLRALGYLE